MVNFYFYYMRIDILFLLSYQPLIQKDKKKKSLPLFTLILDLAYFAYNSRIELNYTLELVFFLVLNLGIKRQFMNCLHLTLKYL